MFGNSYTALVIQVNNKEAGNDIWNSIKRREYNTETERLRIHYFDLDIMVIQGTADYIASIQEPINKEIDTKFGMLKQQRQVMIETCSNIAKNTFMRGQIVEEEVESIECARLSLVFYGYADILPFLTLINVPLQHTSPPPPRPLPPRAVNMPPRSIPMQSPRPPLPGPGPRNPRPYPRNPVPPPPRNQLSPPIPRNPPPRNGPQAGPPPARPMHPRNMYVPRPLPPRPPFGKPRPRM